ncbi:MAG: PstS family phosphate ABC transporter substrate-binding protein [Candidatus Nitrosocaldus sp.]
MNRNIAIAAVIVAVAIGVVIGVIGTVGIGKTSTGTAPTTTITTTPTQTTQTQASTQTPVARLSGFIVVDGSSTVYPITEVIAEEFSKKYQDVKVTVGISGTGGGFKRFTIGETDINDSSRPITDKERSAARESNVRWVEIPIALEGLSIVVHKDNNLFANDCISIEELREIWKPDSTIRYWSDLNPSYPRQEIRLYGAGPDSGTFDYFTEHVVGKARASRTDYIPSEDDNVLVQGVSADRYALGYIPLAYAQHAQDRLKILNVSNEKGGECVFPDSKGIIQGKYPLSRPLFIHVNYDKIQSRQELKEFVLFYLNNAKSAAEKVGYIPLSNEYYTDAIRLINEGRYAPDDDKTFVGIYREGI